MGNIGESDECSKKRKHGVVGGGKGIDGNGREEKEMNSKEESVSEG